MKIAFYNSYLVNLKRFVGDIIDELILLENVDVILIYDEFSSEGYEYFKDKKCTLIKNQAVTYNQILRQFKAIDVNMFIVLAQRINDAAFVGIAKSLHIKTGWIQHGMYIEFAKRGPLFIIKNIIKTMKFFMYTQTIARLVKKNRFEVFKKFYNVFLRGKIFKNEIDFTDALNTDFILIHGEYWKHYHQMHFGYNFDQQHLIGYPELAKVDSVKSKKKIENSVCYIAQTLVEDGRLDIKIMNMFLDNLEFINKQKKIFVKLHPRSNRDLYEQRGFELIDDEVPHCEEYIGHYSSLLALAGHVSDKVVLYEFEGHPIQEYFKAFSYVTYNYEDFNKIVLTPAIGHNQISNSSEYYFAPGYETKKAVDFIMSEIA